MSWRSYTCSAQLRRMAWRSHTCFVQLRRMFWRSHTCFVRRCMHNISIFITMLFRLSTFQFSLVCVFLQSTLRVECLDPSTPRLQCDDILRSAFPDLCHIHVEKGHVTVRNLRLTYWRMRGETAETSETIKTPLLLAHGGPAFSHRYLLPLKQQACRGREIAFWDQGGAGESVRFASGEELTDVERQAPWLLTLGYYREEVNALVAEFHWERFHFFGNSWGTVLSQTYALQEPPDERLQGIVLSGPISDAQLYISMQWDTKQGNLGSLPLHTQAAIREIDQRKAYTSPFYTKVDDILTYFFTSRTVPVADCVAESLPVGVSLDIYKLVQGPSEFSIGGVLKDFNTTGDLHRISNPVLLTHGRYDTMRPAVVDALYDNLRHVWRAELPRSGHLSMVDDPFLMNEVVGRFLDAVEAGTLESFDDEIPEEARDTRGLPLTLSGANVRRRDSWASRNRSSGGGEWCVGQDCIPGFWGWEFLSIWLSAGAFQAGMGALVLTICVIMTAFRSPHRRDEHNDTVDRRPFVPGLAE